ncbi:MAG: hypothetical protein HY269_01895 [Deltaproteobacteria bacterium]|nr:hypothetical protein [Deltaproteobacteria bacterium]
MKWTSLLFGMVSTSAVAGTLLAGHWEDTTGKGRTGTEWTADYDLCEKQAEKIYFSNDVPPGPAGHYYGNAFQVLKLSQTYINTKCLPAHHWRWITEGTVRD